MKNPFSLDLQQIRRHAREHVERGSVVDSYRADRVTVLRLLNGALATELVCSLRYKRHYFVATGIHARPVAQEFLEHAREEEQHADLIAARIVQLGGAPDFNPEGLLSRSHAEYVEGSTLIEMVREDLIAERIAIETYSAMVRYLGGDDATTRRIFERILENEEEHAEDLATIIAGLSHAPEEARGGSASLPHRKAG